MLLVLFGRGKESDPGIIGSHTIQKTEHASFPVRRKNPGSPSCRGDEKGVCFDRLGSPDNNTVKSEPYKPFGDSE